MTSAEVVINCPNICGPSSLCCLSAICAIIFTVYETSPGRLFIFSLGEREDSKSTKENGWRITHIYKPLFFVMFLDSTLPETNSKSPWKWMVGRRMLPFGMAYFQGRTVSFRERISPRVAFHRFLNHQLDDSVPVLLVPAERIQVVISDLEWFEPYILFSIFDLNYEVVYIYNVVTYTFPNKWLLKQLHY